MFKRIITLFFCILLTSCSLALNTSAEECDHIDYAWGVAKDPTCTKPGYKITFCDYCGYEEETEKAPYGHDYGEGDRCITCNAILGDINADAEVNVLDLVELKGILLNQPQYSYIYDMDADDILNAVDMSALRKMLIDNF